MKDKIKITEEEFFAMNTEFHSAREAIQELSGELESIAKRYHLSVDQFLIKAEESVIDKDDYFKGLALAKRIAYLKESDF